MSRFFAFGCSFTKYIWLTWADLISDQFDYYENWGASGGGNHYIFNSVHECNQRNNFKVGDTVIVCWSSTTRIDFYKSREWSRFGNIYTQPLIDRRLRDLFDDERGFLIRDAAYVEAVSRLLQQTNVFWYFISMLDFNYWPKPGEANENQDVLNMYYDDLKLVRPSYEKILKDRTPLDFDTHPTPAEHLAYLDAVLPELPVSDQTRLKIAEEDRIIRSDSYKIPVYQPPDIKRL